MPPLRRRVPCGPPCPQRRGAMAELRARLEALERRMERAEAALRDRPLAALWLHGVSAAMAEPGGPPMGRAGGTEGA